LATKSKDETEREFMEVLNRSGDATQVQRMCELLAQLRSQGVGQADYRLESPHGYNVYQRAAASPSA
jgi:hypothetical protein